jgi:hypothetical protein
MGLLAVLGVAVFAPAVWFPPTNEDDILMLSAVARAGGPWSFFVGDWGLGNHAYRPLHSLALWLSYRSVGVSAGYSQLSNLVLHLLCIGLLYRIVRSILASESLAFLFTAMSLVSLYTVSPAVWVSDRPTLLVAVCLLLWLRELFPASPPRATSPGRLAAVLTVLSLAALMSKESGLIIPLFGLYWGVTAAPRVPGRRAVIGVSIVVIAGYAGFRWLVFGAQAAVYSESGYLLGLVAYSSWADLPAHLKAFALFENVAKNVVAPFLPVFTDPGAFLSPGLLAKLSPIWLPTMALSAMAWRGRLSPMQKAGLAIVLLNAALHVAVFGHRILYLSQLGFSLFLAGSRIPGRRDRRAAAAALATACLLGSLLWVARDLNVQLRTRYEMLAPSALKSLATHWHGQMDDAVIDQVLRQYTLNWPQEPE